MSVSPRLRSLTTHADDDSDVYGPGTDLTLSLVAGMIAMVAFTALLYHNAQSRVAELQRQLKTLQTENGFLREKYIGVLVESKNTRGELDKYIERDVLSFDLDRSDPGQTTAEAQQAAKDRAFKLGAYELPAKLTERIDEIVIPEIIRRLQKLGPDAVDTIEIIGHTDDMRVTARQESKNKVPSAPELGPDDALYHWLNSTNRQPVTERGESMFPNPSLISVHSNPELGFLRAVNVMLYLHEKLRSQLPGGFRRLKFRAYSAGPTVLPSLMNESDPAHPVPYTYGDPLRRRIEIKFTKSKGVGIVDGEAFRVEGRPAQKLRP